MKTLRPRKTCVSIAFLLMFCPALPHLHGQGITFPGSSSEPRISSSVIADDDTDSGSGAQAAPTRNRHAFLDSIGIDIHIGVNGIGGDIALPVAQHFNLRLGGQYFQYSDTFAEDGANVAASLQVGNGVAAVDWYPFHTGLRISPQVVFAIQTQVQASVIVPGGQSISLDGQDFISSPTNPLQGSGFVNTRKAAPGISIGWGNISPRGNRRLTFPVEAGFYYIGQPNLRVNFSGTACEADLPATVGCEDVTQDASFQSSLNAFIARNQHNVSYASFFPIASIGIGYRF